MKEVDSILPRGAATSWATEPTSLRGVRGGQQQQRVKQRVWEQHVVCMFVCTLHTNMYFLHASIQLGSGYAIQRICFHTDTFIVVCVLTLGFTRCCWRKVGFG